MNLAIRVADVLYLFENFAESQTSSWPAQVIGKQTIPLARISSHDLNIKISYFDNDKQ